MHLSPVCTYIHVIFGHFMGEPGNEAIRFNCASGNRRLYTVVLLVALCSTHSTSVGAHNERSYVFARYARATPSLSHECLVT